MTIGKEPKTGEDKRPWAVTKIDGTEQNCWYESTAKEMVALKQATGYKKRGRYPRLNEPRQAVGTKVLSDDQKETVRKLTRKAKPVKLAAKAKVG